MTDPSRTQTDPTASGVGGAGATGAAPATSATPGRLARMHASGSLKRLVAVAIVLALLLVFIFENTQRVKVSYLGATGHLPLGVALLLAAVAGALLLGMVGAVRMLQLRRRTRRRGARI